jgi:hypothetical protein
LDQAKEIIGKTVELEFKLPNTNSGNGEERQAVAEKLYQDIVANPEKMTELSDSRSSENIFYNVYENANLGELPIIYQSNIQLLSSLSTGQFSPILEGTYGNAQSQDENGAPTLEELNGFTFFRILDKQS